MSWIKEGRLNFLEWLALNVIKCGETPRHIAFIMDGNRRYASRNRVNKSEGHSKGFDKLAETLKWCLDLGVEEVTVYAFSIENFKRSPEEVDCLMDLARQKFEKLLEEEEKLMREGVNIRVIGDVKLLPADLQRLVARAVTMTRGNTRARLNVAFAYTARDEIACAARHVATAIAESDLDSEDVTPALLSAALYTEDSLPPDLLVRTSGEVRLSDFMLWQTTASYIHFTPTLWPDFSFWDLMSAVFHYQRARPHLPPRESQTLSAMASKFIAQLYQSRHSYLTNMLQEGSPKEVSVSS